MENMWSLWGLCEYLSCLCSNAVNGIYKTESSVMKENNNSNKKKKEEERKSLVVG